MIGQSLLNAASITINNVNISWQYDQKETNFSINSTLAAGINPGLVVQFDEFLMCYFFNLIS